MFLLVRNSCLLHFELQRSHFIKKRKNSEDNNGIYTIKIITSLSEENTDKLFNEAISWKTGRTRVTVVIYLLVTRCNHNVLIT